MASYVWSHVFHQLHVWDIWQGQHANVRRLQTRAKLIAISTCSVGHHTVSGVDAPKDPALEVFFPPT